MKRAARKTRFYFHYNKIQSRQRNANFLTLHWGGVCHLVKAESFKIMVPTETKINKRQPRVVIQGWCSHIEMTAEGIKII